MVIAQFVANDIRNAAFISSFCCWSCCCFVEDVVVVSRSLKYIQADMFFSVCVNTLLILQ